MMKRFVAALTMLALVVALSPSPVGKVYAGPVSLASGPVTTAQRDRNVEIYSAWNPTYDPACLWDVDDQENHLEQGNLEPGTIVKTGCLIAVQDPVWATIHGTFGFWSVSRHPRLRFVVDSSKPLTVSFCYQPQDFCRPITSSPDPTYPYHYVACPSGPYYDDGSPALVPIPDSNGGVGVRTTYSLTITNATGRRIRDVWVVVRGGNDQDNCPGTPLVQVDLGDHHFWVQQP